MTLKEIHEECRKIIIDKMFENNYPERSVCCKIWDQMTTNEKCENSIWENFNQRLWYLVGNWFDNYSPKDEEDIIYYFENYFLQLHLFTERIEFIFKMIDNTDYFKSHFTTLKLIRKWANFIKHPKHFSLSHWPEYYFEWDDFIKNDRDIIIDSTFIKKHYSSKRKEDDPIILENGENIIIKVPNLLELTDKFCDELNTFINFVCSDEKVISALKAKSTIENYYDDTSS